MTFKLKDYFFNDGDNFEYINDDDDNNGAISIHTPEGEREREKKKWHQHFKSIRSLSLYLF